MPPAPAGDAAATSENDERDADMLTDTANAASPPRPAAEAPTEPPAGNSETAASGTAGETAATGSTAVTEPPSSPTNAETEPAAVASAMADATPDDSTQRTDAALEPPLPRARPHVGAAQPKGMAPGHRQTVAAASRPRHVRAAGARIVTRAVRAVRFTAPYYAQTQYAQEQYAQGIEQGYGYGQSSAQAQIAAEQTVIRRAILLRHTRLAAARKLNPATGGPFVSARNP
jgi:hypothetical protein